MAKFTPRKKTTRTRRHGGLHRGKSGDFQKLNIAVSSPRIVMFQCMKSLGSLFKLAMILTLIGIICWGGYRGIQHLFLGNEKYVLQEIELTTNGKLSHSRIVDIAKIDLGASIFAIDIDALKERLNKLPEVTSCDVERRLPGKLRVTLTERVPAAWIESPELHFPGRAQGGILTDISGVTFPCEGDLWQAAQSLPVIVIHGAKEHNFTHGERLKQPDIMRALHLLDTFNQQNIRAQWNPERIVLMNSYSMEAVCNNGSYALFGMYDHDRQLSDFISIQEHTLKTGREVKHINLIPKVNIPVKFGDDNATLITPKRDPIYQTHLNNKDKQEIQSIPKGN